MYRRQMLKGHVACVDDVARPHTDVGAPLSAGSRPPTAARTAGPEMVSVFMGPDSATKIEISVKQQTAWETRSLIREWFKP